MSDVAEHPATAPIAGFRPAANDTLKENGKARRPYGGIKQILANIAGAPRVFFAKGTVPRHRWPFEIDLDAYGAADYEKIIPSLQEIEADLMKVPADKQGMRWIHDGDTVLFLGERTFDIPFEDFVAKVDVSHAGEYYRDSLSVETVVVDHDADGRAIRQGVRVVALPQPNYASFMGKGNLDVYKLEKVDYTEDEQKLWMLTVHSPNVSALCDDGYLAFRRAPDGRGTVVAFLACQNFPVPPLMGAMFMDRWTWFKNVVTEAAYRQFCNTMMQNVLDCYHGKDFRVGRPLS